VVIPTPHQVLDCTGLLDPWPTIKVSAAIKQIEIGQVLQLITTDPGSPLDMTAWSRLTGNDLLDWRVEADQYLFYFQRVK